MKEFINIKNLAKADGVERYIIIAQYGNYSLLYRNADYMPWIVANGLYEKGWNWGHYFTELKDAVMYIFEQVERLHKDVIDGVISILEQEDETETAKALIDYEGNKYTEKYGIEAIAE